MTAIKIDNAQLLDTIRLMSTQPNFQKIKENPRAVRHAHNSLQLLKQKCLLYDITLGSFFLLFYKKN